MNPQLRSDLFFQYKIDTILYTGLIQKKNLIKYFIDYWSWWFIFMQFHVRLGNDLWQRQLTRSTSTVRQGLCFFVSLILTHLALWVVFRAFIRFSGDSSKYISLSSSDTPSIAYSSKKWPCKFQGKLKQITLNKTFGDDIFLLDVAFDLNLFAFLVTSQDLQKNCTDLFYI